MSIRNDPHRRNRPHGERSAEPPGRGVVVKAAPPGGLCYDSKFDDSTEGLTDMASVRQASPISGRSVWRRSAACSAAAAGLALSLAWAAPGAAQGASVSTNATVQILRPAGIIGLQELNNAPGFLAPPDAAADGEDAAAPTVQSGPITPPASGGALAAAIAISGAPNQTFSLNITDSLVVVTDSGELVVTNFDHNAGSSPTIGANGAAQIAIGAKAQSGSSDTLQQLSTQAAGPGPGADGQADSNIVAVVVNTDDGPQVIKIQRPDNFGPNIFGEKFFTVLVSYN